METTEEKITVMQAFVNGKSIEQRNITGIGNTWWECENPSSGSKQIADAAETLRGDSFYEHVAE